MESSVTQSDVLGASQLPVGEPLLADTLDATRGSVLLVELDGEDEGVEPEEDDEGHGHPLEDHPALVAVHLHRGAERGEF